MGLSISISMSMACFSTFVTMVGVKGVFLEFVLPWKRRISFLTKWKIKKNYTIGSWWTVDIGAMIEMR